MLTPTRRPKFHAPHNGSHEFPPLSSSPRRDNNTPTHLPRINVSKSPREERFNNGSKSRALDERRGSASPINHSLIGFDSRRSSLNNSLSSHQGSPNTKNTSPQGFDFIVEYGQQMDLDSKLLSSKPSKCQEIRQTSSTIDQLRSRFLHSIRSLNKKERQEVGLPPEYDINPSSPGSYYQENSNGIGSDRSIESLQNIEVLTHNGHNSLALDPAYPAFRKIPVLGHEPPIQLIYLVKNQAQKGAVIESCISAVVSRPNKFNCSKHYTGRIIKILPTNVRGEIDSESYYDGDIVQIEEAKAGTEDMPIIKERITFAINFIFVSIRSDQKLDVVILLKYGENILANSHEVRHQPKKKRKNHGHHFMNLGGSRVQTEEAEATDSDDNEEGETLETMDKQQLKMKIRDIISRRYPNQDWNKKIEENKNNARNNTKEKIASRQKDINEMLEKRRETAVERFQENTQGEYERKYLYLIKRELHRQMAIRDREKRAVAARERALITLITTVNFIKQANHCYLDALCQHHAIKVATDKLRRLFQHFLGGSRNRAGENVETRIMSFMSHFIRFRADISVNILNIHSRAKTVVFAVLTEFRFLTQLFLKARRFYSLSKIPAGAPTLFPIPPLLLVRSIQHGTRDYFSRKKNFKNAVEVLYERFYPEYVITQNPKLGKDAAKKKRRLKFTMSFVDEKEKKAYVDKYFAYCRQSYNQELEAYLKKLNALKQHDRRLFNLAIACRYWQKKNNQPDMLDIFNFDLHEYIAPIIPEHLSSKEQSSPRNRIVAAEVRQRLKFNIAELQPPTLFHLPTFQEFSITFKAFSIRVTPKASNPEITLAPVLERAPTNIKESKIRTNNGPSPLQKRTSSLLRVVSPQPIRSKSNLKKLFLPT